MTPASDMPTRDPIGNDRPGPGAGGMRPRRPRLIAELALAIPPTLVVLASVALLDGFRHQRILFASLASSAFLVYRDPTHPMNLARAMVLGHLVAVALGVGAALLLGAGYLAGAAAMVATIAALVALRAVHPPAVSTALGFAFFPQQDRAAGFFLLALAMLVALIALQRAAAWGARRFLRSDEQPR